MNRYTIHRGVLVAGAGLLAMSTVHCGDPIVILNVDPASLPAETSKLLLRTRLNEQDGKDQWFSPDQTRLAVRLPPDARGSLTFDLSALDPGECKLAQATLSEMVPAGLNLSAEYSVALNAVNPKACSFTPVEPNLAGLTLSTVDLYSAWASDANNVYVAGGGMLNTTTLKSPIVLRCSAGSSVCQPLNQTLGGVGLYSVRGSDASNVFVAGTQGVVGRCSAGSNQCTRIPPVTNQYLRAIWASDASNIYIAGDAGTVLRCSGNANQCTTLTSGTQRNLYAIWGSKTGDIYAVGGLEGDPQTSLNSNVYIDPAIIRCPNGSNVCSALRANATEVFRSVWVSDENDVYVGGINGTIVFCAAGSANCTPLVSGISSPYEISRVWGINDKNIYAISSGGTIARCAAGSTTCTALNSGTAAALNSVWGADDMNVFAVGNNGTVVRCSAGSTSCTVLTSGTNETLYRVWGLDRRNTYIVGAKGTILRWAL